MPSLLPAFNQSIANRRHLPELQRLAARRTPDDDDAFVVPLTVGPRTYGLKVVLRPNFPAAAPGVRLYCGATVAAALQVRHLNIARDAAPDASGYRPFSDEIWSCNGTQTWSVAYGAEQLLEHVRQLLTSFPADAAPQADPAFPDYPPLTLYGTAAAEPGAEAAADGWDTVVKKQRKLVVVRAQRPAAPAPSPSSSAAAAPSPSAAAPQQRPPPGDSTSSLYQVAQLLPSTAEDAASMLAAGGEDVAVDASALTAGLRCFFTGMGPSETTLCLPLSSTTNPRTGKVDVLFVHLDGYVSAAAYREGGLRRTPCGDKFTQLLPLFIDERHFGAAAQALLSDTLRSLRLERLDFFSTLLTSLVVMLADGGVAALERGCHVLCHVLHLADKVLSKHGLQELVDRHVDGFLHHAARRTKAATPNLGHWAALVLMGRKAAPGRTLAAAAPALLMEAFVRNVLWICKNRADVAAVLRGGGGGGGDNAALAAAAFEGSRNSLRVFCIFRLLEAVEQADGGSHAAFVAGLDALSGFASPVQVRRFRSGLAKVRGAESWPEVLRMLNLTPMDDAGIARQVRQAWQLSLAAGYHTVDTDFSSIQRSGVSHLLRKGDTYNGIDRTDQRLMFVSDWRFSTPSSQFLDATLLLTDAAGRCLDTIDYAHTRSCFPGAVSHSGDVMRPQGGEHTVQLSLGRFPPSVAHVFVVVSAWHAGGRLSDVQQPRVTLRDARDGQDLCAYALEEQPRSELDAKQAVVLCRLSRNTTGSTPPWRVHALGEMCMGNAMDYTPIQTKIAALLSPGAEPEPGATTAA